MIKHFDKKIEFFHKNILDITIGLIFIGLGGYLNWKQHLSNSNTCLIFYLFYILTIIAAIIIKKLDKFILILAILSGLTCVFISPIASVPDEGAHFSRALSVSKGVFVNRVVNSTVPKAAIIPSFKDKLSSQDLLKIQNLFHKLDPSDFQGDGTFLNTVVYSPLNYLPQALGMILAKYVYPNKISLFYLARLSNLLFFILMLYGSFKILPTDLKLFIASISLMPMVIYEVGSVSADGVNYSIVILFFSYIIRCIYSEKSISFIDFIVLCLFSLLLGYCKQTFIILVPFIWLIPKRFFKTFTHKISIFACSLFISILCYLSWARLLKSNNIMQVFMEVTHNSHGIYPNLQLAVMSILNHPIRFILLLLHSIAVNLQEYCFDIIGLFGWLTTQLDTLIYTLFPLAIFISMSTLNYKNKISIKTRLIALLIMLLFILATFIALYISWTPINSNIIVGIQGRYFIPIVPALIFVFGNSILTNRHKFIEMLVRMILTISNFGMILVIYAYFYV